MSDILDRIVASKKEALAQLSKQTSITNLLNLAEAAPKQSPRNFVASLQQRLNKRQPAVIAEIKKASPSQGVIRHNFTPEQHAKDYQQHGAACLSVLTDTNYFQGSNDHLQQAKQACNLPVLRKDFMVDAWQIAESKVLGADCVLLILAILDDSQLKDFSAMASQLGMDVLLEAHDLSEIDRAMKLQPQLLGINNRNLQTFEVDLQTTFLGRQRVDSETLLVTESGIHRYEDVQQMLEADIYGFLVGEHLMRQPSPGKALAELFYR